jgi:acetyl esterase/lipase
MVVRDPREVMTRPAPPPDLTVRYGQHPDQVADLRLPPGRPAGPLVIVVHGGFWRAAFDRTHTGPLAADLAGRGYPVATIGFRRMGQEGGGWPGTFDDVKAAIAAVSDLVTGAVGSDAIAAARGRSAAEPEVKRPELGGTRPILVGHSAGGQLALWYARRAPHAVRGVVALAPVADLTMAYDMGLGDNAVDALLGGGPDDVPDRYAEADPARNLPLGVPAVVIHGTDDDRVPVAVGRAYVAAARAAGDDVTLVELRGVEHFAVIDPLSGAWPAVVDALGTFGRLDGVDARPKRR